MSAPQVPLRRDIRAHAAVPRRTGRPGFGLSVHTKIDLCRGLFAVLVVVAHALDIAGTLDPVGFGEIPLAGRELLGHTIGSGFFWVMGFFVISGYCIQGSAERLGSGAGGAFPLRTYLVARLSRILPMYYLALLFCLGIEATIAHDRPTYWFHGLSLPVLAGQVLLIQNLTETFGSFASSWSITNEVFYYVYYGLLVALLGGFRRSIWMGMGVSLGLSVAMQGLYAMGLQNGVVRSTGLLFGLGLIWFSGAAIAAYRERIPRLRWLGVLARGWPLVVALAVALWCGRCSLQTAYLVSGAGFALMMVRFLAVEGARPAREEPRWITATARLLGDLSYPTYLFHGPTLMLVGSAILRWRFVTDWRVAWALLVGTAMALGLVLGVLVERPIMAWRGALLARRRAARPANAGPTAPRRPGVVSA